jgi:hypothetical protein
MRPSAKTVLFLIYVNDFFGCGTNPPHGYSDPRRTWRRSSCDCVYQEKRFRHAPRLMEKCALAIVFRGRRSCSPGASCGDRVDRRHGLTEVKHTQVTDDTVVAADVEADIGSGRRRLDDFQLREHDIPCFASRYS